MALRPSYRARRAVVHHEPRRLARKGAMFAAASVTSLAMLVASSPAWACGGLVGENGTIELVRTTTLAAYHDGVQRYVTGFEFTGEGEEVGSIVPLPDVPTEVERGGDWTLQRLVQEVAPPPDFDQEAALRATAEAADAEVLLETEIDALDITVLRGGADEVGRWATDNGFLLTPDAPEVLEFYAERSEIFMAARFDAERAADLGQGAGDATPIMLTIPTDDPWVPLRILGMGLTEGQQVEADVFVLTDDEPQLLAGGDGLLLERSEPASEQLLTDLRSDEGMEWMPNEMWLTYLEVDAAASDLDYDLAISAHENTTPSLAAAGISAPEAHIVQPPGDNLALWPIAAGLTTGGLALAALLWMNRQRTEIEEQQEPAA